MKNEDFEVKKNTKVSRRKINKKKRIILLLIANLITILSLAIILSVYGKVFVKEMKYSISSLFDENIKNSKKYYNELPQRVSSGNDILLEPIIKNLPPAADTKFSIIIPKLDINQRVITNVDINNPEDVKTALGEGVGWANGTIEPGQDGNSLLFSHSTQNAWDIFRYNSVFTLLRKLDINDTFSVIYNGRQMDFLVFEKYTVEPHDTSYLTASAKGKVVTLQTCDPPGKDDKRLIVRGRLVAMQVN